MPTATGTITYYQTITNNSVHKSERWFGADPKNNSYYAIDFACTLPKLSGKVATKLEVTIKGLVDSSWGSASAPGISYYGAWSDGTPISENGINVVLDGGVNSPTLSRVASGGTGTVVITFPPLQPIDLSVTQNRHFGIMSSQNDLNNGYFSLMALQSVSLLVYYENAATYTIHYNSNLPRGLSANNMPSDQIKTGSNSISISSNTPTVTATDTEPNPTATAYWQYASNEGWTGTKPSSSIATTTYTYVFKNWNTKANGAGVSYAKGTTYSQAASLNLYAIWTVTQTNRVTTPAKTVAYRTSKTASTQSNTTVRLYPKKPPSSSTSSYESKTTNDSVTKTNTYYINHWATSSGDSSGESPSATITWTGSNDIYRYAVANTTADSTSTTVTKRGSISLPSYTVSGYKFLGWATTSSATSANYLAGSNYTPPLTGTPVSLYGVWATSVPAGWNPATVYVSENGQFWEATAYISQNGSWRPTTIYITQV